MATRESARMTGKKRATASGSIGRLKRRKPYAPIFRRMLARTTLPAVGASTCASGSHVWSGNIGTLTAKAMKKAQKRSEEHTSELQSRLHLVCRLLLEKKKKTDRI